MGFQWDYIYIFNVTLSPAFLLLQDTLTGFLVKTCPELAEGNRNPGEPMDFGGKHHPFLRKQAYPLVNIYSLLLKMAIYSEFIHKKLWFSIVMLVYQRVNQSIEKWTPQDLYTQYTAACGEALGLSLYLAGREIGGTRCRCSERGSTGWVFFGFVGPTNHQTWSYSSNMEYQATTNRYKHI